MIADMLLPRAPRPGRRRAALLALAAASIIVAPGAAHATTGDGPGSVGSVTVEPSTDLPEESAEVVVRGTGFDPSAGVYVAVCVDNGPGEKPTPCIGGADTAGVGGAIWISDNPPSYAEGLTQPYGPDGSFEVTLPVPATDDVAGVDCRVDSCAVTVRFDHLRADDRRADHVVPVTFAAAGPGGAEDDTPDDAPADEPTEEPAAEPTAEAADDADESTVSPEAVSDDAEAADEDDGGLSAGSVAAVVALVVIGVALLVWLVRRRRPERPNGDGASTGDAPRTAEPHGP